MKLFARVRGDEGPAGPNFIEHRSQSFDVRFSQVSYETKIREQRETLARFITTGILVRQTYETLEPRTLAAAKEWDTEVCRYLDRTFSYAEAVLFQQKPDNGPCRYNLNDHPPHISMENYKVYLFFNMRIARLRKLIEKLKDEG